MVDRRKKLLGKLSKLVKTQAQSTAPFRRGPCLWPMTPFNACQFVLPDVLPFGCPDGFLPSDTRQISGGCKDVDGNPVSGRSNCSILFADDCGRFNCEVCDSKGRVIPDCPAYPCFDGPGNWDSPPLPPLPPDSPWYIEPPVPGGPAVPGLQCLCGLVKKNSDGSYIISDDEFRRNFCGTFASRKPCEYVTDENGRPVLDDNGNAKFVDPNCIPVTCPHIKNTENDNPLDHGHIFCSDVGSGTNRDPLMINDPTFQQCIKEYCRRFPNCSAPIRFPNTPTGTPPPSRWRGWTSVTMTNPCINEIMQRINTVCTDISNVKPDENPLIDSQPEKDPSDRMTIEDQLP